MIRIARKITEEFLESGEGNPECLPRTSAGILRYVRPNLFNCQYGKLIFGPCQGPKVKLMSHRADGSFPLVARQVK